MTAAAERGARTEGPPGPGVAALDRLAERLLAAAAPLRVDVARGAGELDAIYRLRYRHVVEHGWASAEAMPDGREHDRYDDAATHVAAWDGEALVGTVRLVAPAPGRRLPTEEAFELDIEPRGRVVDVGRLLISERYRGEPSHAAWGALFGRAWIETRAAGCTVLGGVASARLVALFATLGLRFDVLGAARPYWGQDRHPVRLDPDAGSTPGWFDGRGPRGA